MNLNDIMSYMESEIEIINDTPCELCGSDFVADEQNIEFIDGYPHTITSCLCNVCGHNRDFEFSAPFIGFSHAENKDLVLFN